MMFFNAIAWISFVFCLVSLILFCHRAGQIYKVNDSYASMWVHERAGTVMKMMIVMVVSVCWLIWG